MLILNGVVHPMDGPVIPRGFVAFEGEKLTAVGPMEALPAGAEGPVLDAEGGHILPGFIDAHCHLGLFGDALGFEADDGNESTCLLYTSIGLSYQYTIRETRDSMERNADYVADFTAKVRAEGIDVRDMAYQLYVANVAHIANAFVLVTEADGELVLCSDGATIQSGLGGNYLPQSIVSPVSYTHLSTGTWTMPRRVSAGPSSACPASALSWPTCGTWSFPRCRSESSPPLPTTSSTGFSSTGTSSPGSTTPSGGWRRWIPAYARCSTACNGWIRTWRKSRTA